MISAARVAALLWLALGAGALQAQTDPQSLVPRSADQGFPGLLQTSKLQDAHLLEERNLALLSTGAVDPDTYVLGPGDVLGLEVTGAFSLTAEDLVGADGSITFDQLGTLPVAGLTLAQARQRVEEAGRRVISSSRIDLVLRSTRAFKVYVTGKVVHPGAQRASALTHVSEVVSAAGGFTEEGSLRDIVIKRRDGTEISADLLPFLSRGSASRNPTLLDGDLVVVPPRRGTLIFDGAVDYPGHYSVLPGDRLSVVLPWVGLSADADSTHAWLERYQGDGAWKPVSVDLTAVLNGTEDVTLAAHDRLLVPYTAASHLQEAVDVLGAVHRPGPVPLVPGKDRARDLVDLAGGPLPDALLERAVLARSQGADTVRVHDPTSRRGFLEDVNRLAALESIMNLRSSEGPVVQPGDTIWIPWTRGFVQVMGQVKQPGVYDFVAGWRPGDYIDAAGGFGQQADKKQVRVSLGQHGQAVFASDIDALAPGDLLWVPERPPGNFWESVRNAATLVTALATVVLLVREVSR